MTTSEPGRTASAMAHVGIAAGGCAALMVLSAVALTGRSGFGSEPAWHVLYSGSAAVQALGAIVAVLVSIWWLPTTARVLMSVLGLVVGTVASVGSEALIAGFTGSVAAGLALGCLAGHAAAHADRRLVTALLVGAVSGVMGYRLLRPIAFNGTRFDTAAAIMVGLVVVAAAALVTAAVVSRRSSSGGAAPIGAPSAIDRRAAVGGVALAVLAVVVDWAFTAAVAKSNSVDVWWWGWTPVVAMVVTGLALRAGSGAVVLIAAAWAVSRVGEITWAPQSLWLLPAVAVVVASTVIGYRVRRPLLGIVVLALCSASYLIFGSPLGDVYSMTTVFVAPAAVAFALAGVIAQNSPSAPATATALSGPVIWVIAPQLVFVVFAGSDGDDRTFNSSFGPQTLSAAAERAIPMVIAIIVCGIALAVTLRRQQEAGDGTQ